MRALKNLSFRRKIFAGMLLAAIVPMLVGYLLMMQIFNITYRNNLEQEARTVLNAASGSLDSSFSHIYDALAQLGHTEVVRQNLRAGTGSEASSVYRELYTITSEYGEYAYFSIYDSNGHLVSSLLNNSYIREKLPLDWGILYEAERKPDTFVVRNARIYQGEDRVEYLRVASAVQDTDGRILGYVTATVLGKNFDYILKGIVNDDPGVVYLVDDFHETVYCSDGEYDREGLRRAKNELWRENNFFWQSEDHKHLYYVQKEENSRLYVFYQQPTAALDGMKNNVITIAIISGGIGLLVCVFLSGYISRFLYQPLQRLQAAMREVKKGNFKSQIQVDSGDELGQLSNSFNVMAEHLNENMERLLQRERELSEANIKMMQAQLNPHFLYNTLDTLKWLGKANQIPEIVTISAGLAKILRKSISAKPKITLAEEVELAEAYVNIQKIRFEDQIEFFVEMPQELEGCIVPKLILQPIVENCILHGFAHRGSGSVTIRVEQQEKEDEQQLVIAVEDDGDGMPPERVAALNTYAAAGERFPEEEDKKKNSRIGYFNVNAIIRLNYGEKYGLWTTSEAGKGTCVYMTMPLA